MTDLDAAAAQLSQARSAFYIRQGDDHAYVRMVETEVRYLRVEVRELRQDKAALERALRRRQG